MMREDARYNAYETLYDVQQWLEKMEEEEGL
jgi:hypothetical protein